ncbi:hypothetical protein Scep_010960 [Stephania cephalantha]|uniref:Uncharacterized protein n=1 Tax=Stephania cephalantha TaxID=152367 RepID=A0AAP0PFT5_9MAGN
MELGSVMIGSKYVWKERETTRSCYWFVIEFILEVSSPSDGQFVVDNPNMVVLYANGPSFLKRGG